MSKAGNLQTVRNWNEKFPPGTTVIFQGAEYKTFAWAGLNEKWIPAVFIKDGPPEPVPLSQLTVPGFIDTVVDKRKRPNERPSTDRGKK